MSAAVVILVLASSAVLVIAGVLGVMWYNNRGKDGGTAGGATGGAIISGDGGPFKLTKYWVPISGQKDMGPWLPDKGGDYSEERTLNAGEKSYRMRVCKNRSCGTKITGPSVDYHMFTKCNEEGSCIVDGVLYNLRTVALQPFSNPDQSRVVFYKPPEAKWGLGNKSNALTPFVSVATEQGQFAYGKKLMIPALKGVKMPTGVVHNGCVRADDVGPAIKHNHIDLFVGKYDWKIALDQVFGDGNYTVTPDPSCQLLDYKVGVP